MRNPLKYLIPAIVMVVTFISVGKVSSMEQPVITFNRISRAVSVQGAGGFDVSSPQLVFRTGTALHTQESCCRIQTQESVSLASRLFRSVRRSDNVRRHNGEFVKSCRLCNAYVVYSNQMHSVIDHSTQYEPAHMLVNLRKLVI